LACSYRLNQTRVARAKTDGLFSLVYNLVNTTKHSMYTKFYIDIRRIEMKRITLYIDGRPTMDVDIEPGNGALKSLLLYLVKYLFGVLDIRSTYLKKSNLDLSYSHMDICFKRQ